MTPTSRRALSNLATIAAVVVLHLVSDPLPDAVTIGRDLDRPDCLAVYSGGAKAEVIAPDDPRFNRLRDFIREWQ